MEISSWISHHANHSPEKTALHFENRSITYRMLEDKIAQLASVLVNGLDLKVGDRFAYLGENSVEMVELFFACARVGAIFVPLNARMTSKQHQHFLTNCEPRYLLVEFQFWLQADTALQNSEIRKHGFGDNVKDQDPLDSMINPSLSIGPNHDLSANTPVMIAYTSGSTGLPKGAVLAHETIHYASINAVHLAEMTASDHILTNLPMFHVGGLTVQTLPAFYIGATVTIHRNFDAGSTLREIEAGKITTYLPLPKITRALTQHDEWQQTDLSSLRITQTGSTIVPMSVLTPWTQLEIPAQQIYGLTEALPPAIGLSLSDSESKAGSMGKATMYCEVRIVDSRSNNVATGERGEILLKGPCVFTGYWKNQKATEAAFSDGWFHTGDIAHEDEEGYIYMDDRLKHIIIVGSSNVYPADIEHILSECDEISEAAVVRKADSVLGEAPVAFIQLKHSKSMDQQAVMDLFTGKLADYQIPHEIRFVDSSPRTSLGKIQKMRSRDYYRKKHMPHKTVVKKLSIQNFEPCCMPAFDMMT
jgi:fatty-acyl-CoA synthase